MIKELYINKINEISLNVTQSKIDSIKKRVITKSGCRIYKDGYIGIAGTLGEATMDTWKKAEYNLKNKIEYKFEPCKDLKRTRDLREDTMSANEFLNVSEEVLQFLRHEYPDFIFGNKMKMIEKEIILRNDAGLEYKNIDKCFNIELIVKEKDSVNIFDTDLSYIGRTFNKEGFIKLAKETIGNFKNKVELPKCKKVPIVTRFFEVGSKVINELDGNKIGSKASIFEDKIGKEVFSKDFTVYVDRSSENIMVPFFDSEGSTLNEDKVKIIDKGVIKLGFTDKRTAQKYNMLNTAAASSSYDGISSVSNLNYTENIFSIGNVDKTLNEIIGDKEAIYIANMSGGDCTDEGIFSSPVQTAYLMKNGKIVGRLPEFNVRGSIYDMFGKDYLGNSKDKNYSGEEAIVIYMEINP